MATLDVSSVLLDPDIASRFAVKRRIETVSNVGRSQSAVTTIPGVVGVVCAASPNDLDRLPEEDRMGRHITVVTKFRLYGPSKDAAGTRYKPDIVSWQGDDFVVKDLAPYPQYGSGFVQAICGSVDMIDMVTP